MALETYRKKRQFNVTPEPRGKVGRKKGNSYVIQKHAATRLHYDFRLELDGVLLSWAVTRGPSLNPADKRLAIHVEDHPLEYGGFEGTIPEGEYGGGTVMLWDRGTWEPVGDPHRGMKKGHLDFVLHGEKLKGEWHLVRMKKRPGERQEPWLLIKAHDEFASDTDILEEEPLSVDTGRDIAGIAGGKKGGSRVWHSKPATRGGGGAGGKTVMLSPKARLKAAPFAPGEERPQKNARAPHRAKHKNAKTKSAKGARKGARKGEGSSAPLPDFVEPMLSMLREHAPADPNWVHEIKLDGYRIQARLDHGEVRLLTRKALDWADKFPNVAEAVSHLDADTALLDGEVVVQAENAVPDFSALQAALRNGDTDKFVYYVFDLLHLDGVDLRAMPLIDRKAALADLIERSPDAAPVLQYSQHFEADGPLVLGEAGAHGLEGIISKRRDSTYVSARSDNWLKIKWINRQEFVVIGYVPSTNSPTAIGALVIGYNEDGKLRYGGRMGTGYTNAVARELHKKLSPLKVKQAPVEVPPDEKRRDVQWVRPQHIAEGEFRGWTSDGILRQAAFKGLREDKSPGEIVREDTAMAPSASKTKTSAAKPARKAAAKSKAAANTQIGSVHLTHPDRVYWGDVKVTKRQLAEFYEGIWEWIEPHIVGRPLSFLRCPDGTTGQCFFQKHVSAGLDDTHLRTVIDKKRREVIGLDSLDGLLSLVQAGILEIHVRGSQLDSLDLCDRIVFDLDPGPDVSWPQIVEAAREVRDRLEAIKLKSFVKVSGGKGVHVVLPVAPIDWETVKTFTQAFAQAMEADDPKRYVSQMTKSLRKGRVFVDYLRNSLEQTSIAAFSTRAREGAPVSVPVSWEELGRLKGANTFTVLNLGKRLNGLKADPWKDIGRIKQKLPDLKKLTRS